METEIPSAWEPPLAKITGIQFGLLNSADIYKLSVCPRDIPLTKTKELADPRLGLPLANGICGTCNGESVDQCQGHFAHVLLPLPIFHPNHVGKLVSLLRKICLNCGQPKRKKLGKSRSSSAPRLKKHLDQNASTAHVSTPTGRPKPARVIPRTPVNDEGNDEDSCEDADDNQCSVVGKNKRRYADAFIERAAKEAPVIDLSSDDEDFSSNARMQSKSQSEVDEEDLVEKASSSTVPVRRSCRKRKSPSDSNENHSITGPLIDLTNVNVDTWNPLSVANSRKKRRIEKGKASQSSEVVVADIFRASPEDEEWEPVVGPCKWCSGNSERYPEVLLKVEVKERNKDENLSKAIKMEYKVKQKDTDNVGADYWSFVEPSSSRSSGLVKRSRYLLPSEALKILAKIPETALSSLGMHPKVARPEGLIVELVPVPPNCTRIQDDAFGSTNIGFKQGIDRATMIFSKLLNKISSINKARFGKPVFDAASAEAMELQSLFGLYLREKGAAKAVPGKEKKRIDHVGRVQKRDSRWSLEWLKRHVLGKRGGYSARNVLTGDPFLRVEEIGIPQLVAKYVTIPERVNRLNVDKLQACVEVGQNLMGRYRACGAVRLLRGGERLEVTRKTSHDVQIGDIVHRHLRDGDLVYVNRPPSLHKHSLLALRVHIQDNTVFTINPAICAPLHADFDGDCLHIFVPQSEEAKAELHQLMTIPEQILPSPEGKTIIGMSQDNILATHLLTSSPVFLNKEAMYQMAMWTAGELPIPAIVKSARGPLWAGKQVIDLTIPKDFSFQSGAADIQHGELVSYGGNENWLTSTNGLMRILARHSPEAAVTHLNCAQSALREWLLARGFSVSLRDFYAAPDYKSRREMIDSLMQSVKGAEDLAVNKELLFTSPARGANAEGLEDIAVSYFQTQFSEIGEELGSKISGDNQLLAMVRSGSKGSLSKVLQQIGCLGLQLYKGEHLLSLAGNTKLSSITESVVCEDTWESRGLVKSSLLDGLNPLEFYLHSISVRAGLLRQSLEVTEPGELFKNLMLFLRDLHVAYDGTVRNKSGLEIIQFSYDGVKTPNTDDTSEMKEFVMPGEAVGILAATAIAQPAYQVMLEANHNVGSKKIRPLALLQDTIFPRSGTKLKASDRRTILRLKKCTCTINNHCEERRALRLKNEIQPVSVEMVASAISIQYVPENSLEWNACRADGVKLRLPWIGHMHLDKTAMIQSCLSMEQVVSILAITFKSKSYAKVLASSYLGNPVFFWRNVCDCMRPGAGNSVESGPCLHFSASLKSRTSKRMASRSSKKALEFVDGLRDVMVPLILKTTVKGDERIESARIIWEDAAWSPSQVSSDGDRVPINPDGELVVEVNVQEKVSTSRGSPWCIMKEACATLDLIDWQRSAPYSVQEVRHSLGVEAARDCVLQRLTLATQVAGTTINTTHLKLVSDLMVHSGDVNGITPFGYRDLLHSLKASAPFTAGAFRAPIKTFMEAGEKGDEEILSGVLASSIFGKRVPVGTGADFSLQLQPKVALDPSQLPMQSLDMFDCLAKLNSKIKDEFPESSEAEVAINHDACGDRDTADRTDDVWGCSNADMADADGAWGSNAATTDAEGVWGADADATDVEGGWGFNADCTPDAEGVLASNADTVDAEGLWGSSADPGGLGSSVDAADWCSNVDDGVCNAESGGWGSNAVESTVEVGGWDANADGGSNGDTAWGSNSDARRCDADDGDLGVSTEWGVSANGAEPEARTWDVDVPSIDKRDKEPRPFRPTGANCIELGKRRQFGTKAVDVGHQPDRMESSHVAEEGNWALKSVQECGSESTWEDVENQGLTSHPMDIQATRAGTLCSPPGHTNESTPGWSPRAWQSDGAGHHGQAGGERGASNSGGSTPRREPTWRALDSRKDSEDWSTIVGIVRDVREILQAYEPEERLKEEHHQVLITQVLPHHPSSVTKIGCGVDYFKVANYQMKKPNDRPTKCFFLVRTDGSQDDFSYHKCLQTMAAKTNPPLDDLYATAFMKKSLPFDKSVRFQK